MSHHFDTPTALEDPRINVCDFYLFEGQPGTVVMAMTVNPDAGVSAPDTFRGGEGLYAFRFDLDGDLHEDVTFKVRFGLPVHAEGDEHRHVQTYEVRRAVGVAARSGAEGALLLSGVTGEIAEVGNEVKVFAGLAPDVFAGDAAALGVFRTAFYKDNQFNPAAFENRKNFFALRNVCAIVLQVPIALIGEGRLAAWATASLHGHAPEVQVSRWGVPLLTNIFMIDPEMREAFNRGGPHEDQERFGAHVQGVVEGMVKAAGSSEQPAEYARRVAARLCPAVLPYDLGTAAWFDVAGFNGRPLGDDAMDVILALTTNTPLSDGVAPDQDRIVKEFPFFGRAYDIAEQEGLAPARPVPKKS